MSRQKRRKNQQRAASAAAAVAARAASANNPFAAQADALRALLDTTDTVDAESAPSLPSRTDAARGQGASTPGAAEHRSAPLDDEAAFAAAMGADIAPIAPRAARAPRKRPPRAAPPPPDTTHEDAALARQQAAMAMIFDAVERPCWPPAGTDEGVDALLRGSVGPDKSVDLHGMRVDQALARLRAALGEAPQRRWRCLRVIHGQGHHSDGDPVLRRAVREALQRQTGVVRAWCETMQSEGGAGATLVLLNGPAGRRRS